MDTQTEMRDRSMGDLAKQLSQDVSELVRREADLAKAELAAKGRKAAVGGALIGSGAVLALVMLGSLAAAAIMALDITLADWLSALIVAVVVGLLAAALMLAGKRSITRATPPVPTQTVHSVKEDMAWLKTRAKSSTK
jgi:uncharacterized membrane protein YqjE